MGSTDLRRLLAVLIEARTVRFRVAIAVAFLFLSMLTTAALMGVSEHAPSTMRETEVAQQVEAAASLARARVLSELGNADVVLDTLVTTDPYPGLSDRAGRSLTLVLKNKRESSLSVSAAYAAFPDGSFALARRITLEAIDKAKALSAVGAVASELQVGTVRDGKLFDSFLHLNGN